jgi:sec-independent protein translocase protein TatB
MPSFQDSIFLFVLALLLFGPKKLPVLARELGKWVGEFRRASNEFKMQMEEELRASEREEREKKLAAIEASAPSTTLVAEPEHPHLPAETASTSDAAATETPEALPIATSGEINLMPPPTGLPVRRGAPQPSETQDAHPSEAAESVTHAG